MNQARILIVEDEFIVANDIEARLLDLGYAVAGKADNGADAIELAGSLLPDLVLMDIRLRGSKDGITAAAEIRQRFRLPVVFLTAFADDSTLERAKSAEPFGYILKPFEDRELRTNIEIAVYKHKAESEIHRLSRLYATLSQVNQAIVRVRSREELFPKICEIALEFGHFKTAWIGLLDDSTGAMIPIAKAGDDAGVTIGEAISHCGCTSAAIQQAWPCMFNKTQSDERAVLCQESAQKAGLRACASYPIRLQNQVCGVFVVGTAEADFFNDAESRLLDEIALDVSFALDTMETERQNREAEDEVKEREGHLATVLRTALDGFWLMDMQGRLQEVNDIYCAMSGYTREELLQMRVSDLESSETEEETAVHIQRIMRKGGDLFESRHRRKDGKVIDVEIHVAFQNFDGGQFVCFLRDVTERKRAEHEREVTIQFLHLVNTSTETREMIRAATTFFQAQSGCEAVGVRLRDGDDFPYYEARGFPQEFVLAESKLCARDSSGEVIRDSRGNPLIECMCGNVIRGGTDASKPFFTSKGSFWTNGTTELLAGTTEADRQSRTRNRCNGEGYESVALIPLRVGDERFGLLQLNDRRKGQFSPQVIALWERLADHLAVALAKFRAEAAMRQSETRYRSLFENMSEGLAYCKMLFDDRGRAVDFVYLDVNNAFEELTSLRNVVGKRVTEVIPEIEKTPELFEIYGRVALTGQPEKFEIEVKQLGAWFSVSAYSPQREHFVAVFENITERKHAEEGLRRSEQRLAQAIGVAGLGIFEHEHSTNVMHCSPLFRKIIGFSRDEPITPAAIIGKVLPEDREILTAGIRSSNDPAGTGLSSAEYRIARPDGIRWIAAQAQSFFEGEESLRHPVQSVGAVQDITERKHAESELQFRNLLLTTEQEVSIDGILVVDEKDRIISHNHRFVEMWGISAELIEKEVDEPILQFVAGQMVYPRAFYEKVQYLYQHPHEISADELLLTDGRAFDRYSAPMWGADAQYYGRVWNFRDVTERKRVELALSESQHRLQVAMDAAKLGVWSRDLATGEIFWDARTRAIYGIDADTVVTYEKLLNLIAPEDRELFARAYPKQFLREIGNPTAEYRVLSSDGTVRWILGFGSPMRDGSGSPTRLTGVVMDITQKKAAEQEMSALETQLRHAQKMEAVGRLAGGVAHDFNNLLMVIRSYAEMMHDSFLPGDSLRKKTQQILQASDRAASLTGQLLAFSRKQITSSRIIDLNKGIGETIKMLRRLVGEDVDLQFHGADTLWAIKADPDQIVQVLMNLCVNSRDAMPRGGALTITTSNVTLRADNPEKHGAPYIPEGEYVEVSVADNGIGISKETQERIFEPFFTTKEVGKGTGLGLSTVYGIVEQSGGYIRVASDVGKGACFTIYLPKAGAVATASAAADTVGYEIGTETLLVVEDEHALRESISEFLGSLGYTVLQAGSGQQALSVVADFDRSIDLLLTDVVMPQMGGRELSEMLQSLCPGLKMVYMSGYTDDAVVRYGVKDAGVMFLQKPFSMATLARRVREALAVRDTLQ